MKFIITHAISGVFLMYRCWSVIFSGIQLSVIEFHKDVELYVVKLFVYIGWIELK
jgi:hypothetical protein